MHVCMCVCVPGTCSGICKGQEKAFGTRVIDGARGELSSASGVISHELSTLFKRQGLLVIRSH